MTVFPHMVRLSTTISLYVRDVVVLRVDAEHMSRCEQCGTYWFGGFPSSTEVDCTHRMISRARPHIWYRVLRSHRAVFKDPLWPSPRRTF